MERLALWLSQPFAECFLGMMDIYCIRCIFASNK